MKDKQEAARHDESANSTLADVSREVDSRGEELGPEEPALVFHDPDTGQCLGNRNLYCHHCSYSLYRLPTAGTCPECGKLIDISIDDSRYQPTVDLKRLLVDKKGIEAFCVLRVKMVLHTRGWAVDLIGPEGLYLNFRSNHSYYRCFLRIQRQLKSLGWQIACAAARRDFVLDGFGERHFSGTCGMLVTGKFLPRATGRCIGTFNACELRMLASPSESLALRKRFLCLSWWRYRLWRSLKIGVVAGMILFVGYCEMTG
ncbi:MAG: hypothetical protein ACYTHJ_19930 [Planctomycetota bacterium]|jgi:hypothetical protein